MARAIEISVGDTRIPLAVVMLRNGKPEDIAAYTVKFTIVDKYGTETLAETSTNVSKQPTFAFTATAATNRLNASEHRVENGDRLIFSNSGGALPGGLAASTKYYARDVDDDSFRVATTPNGPAVDITGAGTGTHSAYIVGEVRYALQTADVANAGEYRCWFRAYDSSSPSTIPVRDGIPLVIHARAI